MLFSTGSLTETSSGPYHSVRRTAECFGSRGNEAVVIGTRAAGEVVQQTWKNVSLKDFRKFGPRSLHWAPGVAGWLRKNAGAVEAVSLQGVWLHINSVVADWAMAKRIPYMITVHGNFNRAALAFSSGKKRLATEWFVRRTLAGAGCLHALNEAELLAIREFGVRLPVTVIPNGVDLPSVDRLELAARTEDVVHRKSRVCRYLGRLHPIKNLAALIRAWGRLGEAAESWTLVVAGAGDEDYTGVLKGEAERCITSGRVIFVGRIDGNVKAEWLSRAELFVLPSTSEGMPMGPLEAMAYGIPVVLTRQCNLPEVGLLGAGKLCEPDPESLLQGLSEMLTKSRDELLSIGLRGRRMVSERYTWDHVVDQLMETYAWMLGRQGPPETVNFS